MKGNLSSGVLVPRGQQQLLAMVSLVLVIFELLSLLHPHLSLLKSRRFPIQVGRILPVGEWGEPPIKSYFCHSSVDK